MMKNLRSENAQLVGLGGNMTRCIQQGDWIIPLIDDNGIMTVVFILETILFLESDRMLLLTNNIDQNYPINS